MDERFKENPELVTVLGLDKDKYAWAKSRLTDASLAHAREVKRNIAARLKRLRDEATAASWGARTLMATTRCRASSNAFKTIPKPPLPTTSSTS